MIYNNQPVTVNLAQKEFLDELLLRITSKQLAIYSAYGDYFRGNRNELPFDLGSPVDGDTFNRAVWFGYELEEEPLYYIKLAPELYVNLCMGKDIILDSRHHTTRFKTKFTESEIEEMDPRWLAFKVKVGADDE